tara:strand:- start:2342 stop:2533 length:192 start_codon:yes stop_codon:yes gene_type:complete
MSDSNSTHTAMLQDHIRALESENALLRYKLNAVSHLVKHFDDLINGTLSEKCCPHKCDAMQSK